MILDVQAEGLHMLADELARFLDRRAAVGVAPGDRVGRAADGGGLCAGELSGVVVDRVGGDLAEHGLNVRVGGDRQQGGRRDFLRGPGLGLQRNVSDLDAQIGEPLGQLGAGPQQHLVAQVEQDAAVVGPRHDAGARRRMGEVVTGAGGLFIQEAQWRAHAAGRLGRCADQQVVALDGREVAVQQQAGSLRLGQPRRFIDENHEERGCLACCTRFSIALTGPWAEPQAHRQRQDSPE